MDANELKIALRDEVQSLITSKKKIYAIKLVRELTGGSLKASKAFVEAMEEDAAKDDVMVPCPICVGAGHIRETSAKLVKIRLGPWLNQPS
jgi:hypothetical protein